MLLNANWTIFWIGCCGGLVGEVAKWYQLRELATFPAYCSSPSYWLITLGMILCGGGLAVAYDIEKPSALLIGNIGLSAPLIIKSLAAAIPKPRTKGFAPTAQLKPSFRQFLAGR